MKRPLLFGALVLAHLACAAGPEGIATQEQEIIGGTLATEEDFRAVGAMVFPFGDGQFFAFCTGTLIKPDWVLTAAHCVQGSQPGIDVSFMIGKDVDHAELVVASKKIFFSPRFNINNLGAGHDIAVVQLEQPIDIVEPLPMNIDPITDDLIGKPFVAVGYGVTESNENDSGTKRFVDLTLDDFSAQLTFYGETNSNVCFGDSGGPDLMDFGGGDVRVIGVHSFVTGPSCHSTSASQRVDVQFEPFLERLVNSVITPEPPHCLDDNICEDICGVTDPDCQCESDGFCDDSCPRRQGVDDPDCTANNLDGEAVGCAVSSPEPSRSPLFFGLLALLGYAVVVTRRIRR